MIKLFNLTCDVGVNIGDVHSFINAILKKFKEYSTDPNSDLNNYRYSEIPCNFLENNVCLLHDDYDDDIILHDVPKKERDKFKERFIKIYGAFQVKQYMYEIHSTYPNYPTDGVVKLLDKRLQPYFGADCIRHAMVLTSWGMYYGKDSNNQINVDDNVFGYTNTWEF